MKILIATGNRHKLGELRVLLNVAGIEFVGTDAFANLPDPVEDADTFEGNALIKARTLSEATGLWTLADDSGLEVDALGGEPGVLSARYAGKHGDTPANNAKLLRELSGKADRRARFRCAVALVAPDGRSWTVDGTCEGHIIHAESGAGGFGYDPLFVPEGYAETFAQLGPDVKNSLSHRGKAVAKIKTILQTLV